MEYITLGHSDLKVSRICMGGCPMGQYGWGLTEEQNLLDAVNTAVDNGINFFDTADVYGMGTSEKTLAKALGKRREQVVIATKFGVRVENKLTFYDNSPDWMEKALEGSLKRLKTDYIDLYQVHYRDEKTPISELVEALESLKKKGYIRHFGLSNIHHNDLKDLSHYSGKFVSFQDEYSLSVRKNESDILELAPALQMTPLTWGSLGQGVLTGKYSKDTQFPPDDRRSRPIYVNFHGEQFLKNLSIVEAMRPMAQSHECNMAAVAIRFILDHIPDSVVLCGAKNPTQILNNIQGCDWHLTKEELDLLDQTSR